MNFLRICVADKCGFARSVMIVMIGDRFLVTSYQARLSHCRSSSLIPLKSAVEVAVRNGLQRVHMRD